MNVGYEAKRFFTNYTGLGNYSRFVINALSINYPEDNYFLYSPKQVSNGETSSIISRANVKVVTPPSFYKLSHTTSLWRSWGITSDPSIQRINIFHGLSQEIPMGMPSKIKLVVTVHDLIFLRYPQFYNGIDVFIYKQKLKHACKSADKIIAVSKQTKEDLVHFLMIDPSKIDVIYQGCHPNFKRTIGQEEKEIVRKKYQLPERYILNVGTIEERKNSKVLIKAHSLLPRELQLPIVIVGRATKYIDEVKQCATENKNLDKIIFLHHAAFADFPAIYQQAEVFVYPSFFEGFGIPLIEAIESSIPVITSKGSCFTEAAGPDAVYIDPADAGELAAQLEGILTSASLRSGMIATSKKYIEQFSSTVIASNLRTVYQSLI